MVKIDNNFNPNQNNQTETCGFQAKGSQTCGFETNNLNKTNSSPKKAESSIIKTIGQLLPLAPFVFEQFTGQKVPQMSGTIAEMQMTLNQVANNQQVIITSQQTLSQRLTNLETNANNHLTNLTNQFNSLRLTHTKEQKRIEYNNPNQHLENQEDY
jgi:hypothetical protein